ncbi:MAG: hypothetical protein L0H36_02240 [bacterium]|nr:hypothetical protein [bacterium]MDN5835435.1 hypothetical protein [bacterium]
MNERQPSQGRGDEDRFNHLISSVELGGYDSFDRISVSRETFDNHNAMVMNEFVRASLYGDKDDFDDIESMLVNNVYYFHGYAHELSMLPASRKDKIEMLSIIIQEDTASKAEQLTRLLQKTEPFVPIVDQEGVVNIINSMNIECNGDVTLAATRTYKGVISYYFTSYYEEIYGTEE